MPIASSVSPHDTLLRNLSGAFSGKGWQGPTLLGSLRGVSAREAAIRPPSLKHGIWDLVLHSAYWKYVVCFKLGAVERDSFPHSPSNWPALPSEKSRPGKPDDRAWRADIKLLKDYHAQLMLAVENFDPRQLTEIPPGGKSARYLDILVGIAAHDAYHCGQIQLVKRLVRRKA